MSNNLKSLFRLKLVFKDVGIDIQANSNSIFPYISIFLGMKNLIDSNNFRRFRIQQVDGGFFEKFGSLFREQAEYTATQEKIEKQRVAEAAAQVISANEENEDAVPTPESDGDASLSSEPEVSSDSEVEGEKEKNELIATAWNVSTCVFYRVKCIFY